MATHKEKPASSFPLRHALLILMSLVAGCVDAIGYLSLQHVFTANMTGNIVLLGLAVGQAHFASVLRSLLALAGFVAGALLAAAIVHRKPQSGLWPATVTRALWVETGWLVLYAFGLHALHRAHVSHPGLWLMADILLAALAMGMQSTAARRIGVANITTTVVTSTLAILLEDLAVKLRLAKSVPVPPHHTVDAAARFIAILTYGGGAAIAALVPAAGRGALVVCMVFVLAAVCITATRCLHGR
ncbi:UPF0700 transmembrane protein YoaK [Alicyclobacillus cellulosilyticus]|uniref:UPF0700 transmembrane protein YoaK n=1 Tax=Alicyclobacillus cellulosilyticus TaxID=1003997 RepID=A0A917NGA9_9BACL|nr:YoaK family protein [Alicyclobacillus cellulosilyticus]GGI99000.1 UPF0700 transmembrane protein YoaK [Alicyclobacillus cellulosilyticus]